MTSTATAARAPVAVPALPEPGQVVEVRGSTWAVTDVIEQGLPRSAPDDSRPRIEHVVSLQSLEEDRMGEELDILWELEYGHTVLPDEGLPETVRATSFDDPNTIGALVDAVRWGAVTSANPREYQAPFRSGARLEPYQLEPLRRALESPRANLLLADDVGLGKTIEAGLVIQELLLRHRARSVIIVCPAGLRLKWQQEMREKFGLDFVIVDSEQLAQTRRSSGLAANPFRLHPRVIVSMAWLPSVRAQRLLRDVLAEVRRSTSARRYAFDVLVVDEAHHVTPAAPTATGRGRGYAVDSKRTTAVRELAEQCEHRLFLSATPHNGYTESFTALLQMIDPHRFSRGAEIDPTALAEVSVRRLKTQIDGAGFQRRRIDILGYTPDAQEESAFSRLCELLDASARAQGRRGSLGIAALLLKKRFLSSPWAFARTMRGYLAATALGGEWDDEDDDYYVEVMGSGQSDEEEGRQAQPEFELLRRAKRDDPLSAASTEDLETILAWAEDLEDRPNARLEALIAFLNAICRPDGRTWTNERVVVFTEYADTLSWLQRVLESRGYGDGRLAVIQGSTDTESREAVRDAFTTSPAKDPVRVLLATDAAGEGIDLQSYCHRLVCFDVPFNPSRLEQRIGRIDRYGQHHPPEVFFLRPDAGAPAQSLLHGDLDFLSRIGRKVARQKQDLGEVNPLTDEEISNRFLRRTGRRRGRTGSEDAVNQVMAGSLDLNRRLTRLAAEYDERKISLHLTPQAQRRVLDEALSFTGQPRLRECGSELTDAPVFEVPGLSAAWQPALRGLDTRLAPGRYRSITFQALEDLDGVEDVLAASEEIVPIHLGHLLMRKASRTLRAGLVSSDAGLSRVTAIVVPGLTETCAAAVSRLVLVGRGGLRLHEEVFVTGIRLHGNKLAEGKDERILNSALEPEDLTLAGLDVRERLAALWRADGGRLRSRLQTATEHRAERQQEAVARDLDGRRRADVARAHEIFTAFRRNLRETLAHLEEAQTELGAQLSLWGDDERRQYTRDIAQMRQRLDTLDEEEAREVAGIEERYRDVRHYVSGVVLVFAVSEADATAWQATDDEERTA